MKKNACMSNAIYRYSESRLRVTGPSDPSMSTLLSSFGSFPLGLGPIPTHPRACDGVLKPNSIRRIVPYASGLLVKPLRDAKDATRGNELGTRDIEDDNDE